MTYLLPILLLALVAYLALRQRRMRRYLAEIEEAVRRRQPYLLSKGSGRWLRSSGLTALSRSLNEVLGERERQRREGESYLHQIEITLSNLSEAVIIINSRYLIAMANKAARRLLALPDDCEGKRLEQFISSAQFLEFLQTAEAGKVSAWRELEIKREHGRHLFLEVASALIPHSDELSGQLRLIVLHDITRLKELENVRREFVANVSHELRTPVTVIKGYADTLIDDHEKLSPEDRLRFLQKVQRNVDRLHLLLEDLLTLSRLEGANIGLNLKSAALNKLIGEQVESAATRLTETQHIVCELDPSIAQINIDPVKVAQVVRNVLDNALRYAKGFSTIRIITRLERDSVTLAVEDDGCGIPAKDLPHIFERFYTVDKSRARELGGTGLGLSIVKHIVQLHGGQVKAANLAPKGLRIECRLPLL